MASELLAYYRELVRQRDLLAQARERDHSAIGLWNKNRDGKRRIWTRQDRNRLECWAEEQCETPDVSLPNADSLPSVDYGTEPVKRATSRLERILRRYLDPQWHWVQSDDDDTVMYALRHDAPTIQWSILNWHRKALAEAQTNGTFVAVAPIVEDATNAHKRLVFHYWELHEIDIGHIEWDHEWQYPWGEVEPPHTAALSRIVLYLPPAGVMRPLPKGEMQENICEALSDKTLKGREIAKLAGYEDNSHFRQTLSAMKQAGILESGPGGTAYRRVT